VLKSRVIRAPKSHAVRTLRIPGLGRVAFTKDPGDSGLFARHYLKRKLTAYHRNSKGELLDERDLGSGLVTNVGVLSLANDSQWQLLQ